jgi:hypothetical protein
MSGAPTPPVLPEPFANDADPLYITTIPDTTATPGRASYSLGFPPLTMQPVAGGGKPPFGQDVNGILFALSSHDFYVQSGQLYRYSSAVSTAIGGYAVGTLLGSTDNVTIWFNTADANATDPDGGSAAGWVSLFTSGFQPFVGLTGGTVTLTAKQAARKVITLAGILTSNLTVIVPTWVAPAGRWLFINNTSGSFTTTVRTASGSGVAVPQGGPSNPVEVYGDGTNVYPAVAPLSIPIDQAATPLTIVERTNNGYILGAYFNQNSGLENPTVGAVFVQNSGADGYLRKIGLANLQAQMALGGFAGLVTPSQVPSAAVTQYASLILASAALTGIPTTPTAGVGSTGSQVASLSFANPGVVVNGNGTCIILASGYKIQFGFRSGGQHLSVTFPVTFTSSVGFTAACSSPRAVMGGQGTNFTDSVGLGGMNITVDPSPGSGYWIAIGF